MREKVLFLVGPTAVGKTEIAAHLAKQANADIISCDSMQIYRGMDIVTSKPHSKLRKRIPHHLIDVLPVSEEYDVSRYRRAALKKVKYIIGKGRVPIFVGGTGLYMSILVNGIFKQNSVDKKIRQRLLKQAEKLGSQHLHNELIKVDPEAASKIHPNDKKRVVRALEVFKNTGKPMSYLQKQRKGLKDQYEIKIFCLNMKRSALYERIDKRVDEMFKKGLTQEVKNLLKSKLSKTAQYAIGIKELKGYFEGEYDLEEAKRLIKRNTRQYAKRQLTWFRKDKRIRWINIKDNEKPGLIAKKILRFCRSVH